MEKEAGGMVQVVELLPCNLNPSTTTTKKTKQENKWRKTVHFSFVP
jgi:hypothetical protein